MNTNPHSYGPQSSGMSFQKSGDWTAKRARNLDWDVQHTHGCDWSGFYMLLAIWYIFMPDASFSNFCILQFLLESTLILDINPNTDSSLPHRKADELIHQMSQSSQSSQTQRKVLTSSLTFISVNPKYSAEMQVD